MLVKWDRLERMVALSRSRVFMRSLLALSISVLPLLAFADDINTQVSVREDSFISPSYTTTADKNFDFFGVKYSNLKTSPEFGFKTEVSGLFSPSATTLSYVNVTQMYYDFGSLQVGRKKNDWSLLDEQWNTGFFQPQFRWNPLLPESQGLTGVFFELSGTDSKTPYGLKLFGSVLYIPDQSAGYQIQNGQFQSINPWFQQMPTQIQFDANGQVVNSINWNVQTPDTSKVVFNSSAMAQVYYGEQKKDVYAAASVGYKPSNQLLMAVSSTTLPTAQTNVNIDPQVYYHTVAAVDLRYSPNDFFVGLSAISETPTAPEDLPSNLNYRVYNSRQLYSPVVGYRGYGLEASAAYLQIQGSSDVVQGAQSSYFANYLPQQIGFGSAWKTDLSYAFGRRFLPGLRLETSYMQGVNNDFALWATSANYRLSRQWSLNAAVLLVSADSTSTTASLFQQFQNNDLFTLGATYGF